MKVINTILLLFTYLYACTTIHTDAVKENNSPTEKTEVIKKNIEIKTFLNDSTKDNSSGWGYDIYVEGKRYIHQPHVPAIGGNKGFTTQKEAEKTAGLIVYKIQHNILPPGISVEELDSLGIAK